jgi:hypothetical protein
MCHGPSFESRRGLDGWNATAHHDPPPPPPTPPPLLPSPPPAPHPFSSSFPVSGMEMVQTYQRGGVCREALADILWKLKSLNLEAGVRRQPLLPIPPPSPPPTTTTTTHPLFHYPCPPPTHASLAAPCVPPPSHHLLLPLLPQPYTLACLSAASAASAQPHHHTHPLPLYPCFLCLSPLLPPSLPHCYHIYHVYGSLVPAWRCVVVCRITSPTRAPQTLTIFSSYPEATWSPIAMVSPWCGRALPVSVCRQWAGACESLCQEHKSKSVE